jgi:AcrR family transcriptional regulator
MRASDSLLPAPGRGQYDRRVPRQRRQATQRARLLTATALVLATDPAASVASVIRAAGVGRNSFYEYFDDFEHAREAVLGELERWLVDALRDAELSVRTPVESFRSLSATWFTLATEQPAQWLALSGVSPTDTRPLARAGIVFADALERSVSGFARRGVIARPPDRVRVLLVAAGAEALARPLARDALRAPVGARSGNAVERARSLLVDTAVRLLH